MSNGNVRKILITEYGKCFLGGVVTKDNPYTYHHIKPKRNNGLATKENGALLTQQRHEWFNKLEREYPTLASEINLYLAKYKGTYPEEIEWRINQIFALVKPKEQGRQKTLRRR